MPIPHEPELKIALCEELEKAGGASKAQDIIEKLSQRFHLTPSETEARERSGEKIFVHRVHAAVEQSRREGRIEPKEVSGRGIWKLTTTYFEGNLPLEGEERKELEQRLKAVEDAVRELRDEDLFITRMMANALCVMELNIAGRTLKAVEAKSFKEFWGKKLEATKKKLKDARTVESTFNIISEFDKELAGYVKATKVDTADKAMEIAHSFIKKYTPVALPLKALREDDVWLVDIDVGPLAVKVAKIKVDARTGDILSYEIPEKGSKES